MDSSTPSTTRTSINITSIPQPVMHKSMAVRFGNLVFVSGQLGKGPDGLPLPTIEEQTEQCFVQIKAILEAAGATMQDVLKIDITVTDIEYLKPISDIKKKFFPVNPPASKGAQVVALGLGAMVEIDAIAGIPD